MMEKKYNSHDHQVAEWRKIMGKYKGFRGGAGMNTNTKMNSVISQAKKMQEQMEQVQAEMEEKIIKTSAGGGVIEIEMNGKKELLAVKIKPEAVDPDDVETLEDLIIVAVNDAIKKADDMMSEGMNAITGGINIPGLF